jgi:NAD(P)H-dependent FMN reductase
VLHRRNYADQGPVDSIEVEFNRGGKAVKNENEAQSMKIVVLVGSLRRQSVNRALARVAAENAPADVVVDVYSGLELLPFYNEDLDTEPVDAEVARVRGTVAEADAVLIITPEYNGTIPAVLKNAIDWLSRPYGTGALTGKPVGVLGAALARFGGKWSHDDTSRSVGIAGGRVVEEAELHLTIGKLDGKPVGEVPEVVDQLRRAVMVLVDAVDATVAA